MPVHSSHSLNTESYFRFRQTVGDQQGQVRQSTHFPSFEEKCTNCIAHN